MRKLYWGIITFFLALLNSYSLHADIILNEIMPCNVSTIMNDAQNYTGWVEVYNNSTSSVNLRGYTFVNEYLNKSKETKFHEWTVSADVTIPGGGYVLFFFDEEPGDKHASYKLETDGGLLRLLDNAGTKVNELSYGNMFAHVSWGRYKNDEGYMVKPTPGAANSACVTYAKRATKPTFGMTPGFYTSAINVSLQSESGATIYYTTDGSEPTELSTKYSSAVAISKTTVIRARAYRDGYVLSEIATGTFIFNKDAKDKDYHSSCKESTVPVISISTNPDNFFGDQNGIYVVGTNGIPGGSSCDTRVANYQQDWKRPVNFEYFVDKKQVISQELDAAIMGGCSRQYEMKSLKLTASKKLGNNKIPYDFFPIKKGNEYKSLQLRNGGNDYNDSRIRDGFMQTLIQGRMNIDYQAYQPTAFYINGEYRGQIDLRERTNKDFVYSNYGLDEEDIDLLEMANKTGFEVSTGDISAYNYLVEEVKVGQTSPGYYEKMDLLMDLDSYIDYQIFEQYIGNTDWPGNNMKIWREKNTGRFRWIVYDTDFGFGLYDPGYENYCDVTLNMINFALGKGDAKNWANRSSFHVELFENLMKNETFRQKFLNKYILHLGTTFLTSRVVSVLDSIQALAENEICAHWNRYSKGWASNHSMHDFANKRTGYVYGHLKDYFKLGTSTDLTISANITNADFILNGERLNSSKYTGKYYTGKDIQVQPVAPTGYKFVSWNLASTSTTESILNSSTVWKYYYKGNQPTGNWYEGSYDDTAWDSGSGKFGYADDRTYDVTLDYGGDKNNKYITAYFRTSFDISDLSAIDELSGTLTYDDAVVIYINGQEVKRYMLADGPVSYETLAIDYVNDAIATFSIDKSYLKAGKNVIAVEVHQNVATSSDLTFKLNMDGMVIKNSTSNQAYSANVTGDLALIATFERCEYVKPALFINELCTSNGGESGFSNEYGIYADWIEIYNGGDIAVDLAGMYLTEQTKGTSYQFPSNSPFETTILPGEHKIVWADKETWQGPLHANFKLSAETATTLVLSQLKDGQKVEIDKVSYSDEVGKIKNESYGRRTDGSSEWTTFVFCDETGTYLSTPGEANDSKGCTFVSTPDVIFNSSTVAMNLYPNPAKTFLNIAVNTSDSYTIQVYDDKGRLIESIPTVNEDVVNLNLQGYSSGVYIVRAITKEAVLQQKFIKY